MTPMRHAHLARLLVKACGGLEEAAAACNMKKSRLHECFDPAGGAFLRADVIADLEAYCGAPIYSRELVENRPAGGEGQSLLVEACKTVEGATALMARISNAQEDHVITPAEAREIDKAIIACSDQLRVLSELNARGRRS